VNKIITFLLLFTLLSSCSLDTKSGIWTEKNKITKKKIDNPTTKEKKDSKTELVKKEKNLNNEYNSNLILKLSEVELQNNSLGRLTNNNRKSNFDSTIKNISKYKFSKIKNFDYYEPEIVFEKKNVIFFENNGNILKFNNLSKLVWEKNHYTKIEKKSKPILYLAANDKKLIVADNLAKYYALDIKTGNLLWSKSNSAPFNSQVKIHKGKILVIDFNDVIRCYSANDGSEIWSLVTQKTFIKSEKKLSIAIKDEKVIFNNSIGDITAVNLETGELLWQVPTQNNLLYENSFSFKTSELVIEENSIFFSNNRNRFFSIDLDTGITNWFAKVNSSIKPVIVGDLVFTITNEGFLVILNKKNGLINRATSVLKQNNNRKIVSSWNMNIIPFNSNTSNIVPIGFVVGSKNIYLTLNNGKLLLIDIASGKTKTSIKIDNEKISAPFVSNNSLYIAKDNSIIRLN
jgi:outer membrane protein assembly factor BamB